MPYFLQDKTRQKAGGAKGLLVILLRPMLSKKPAVIDGGFARDLQKENPAETISATYASCGDSP